MTQAAGTAAIAAASRSRTDAIFSGVDGIAASGIGTGTTNKMAAEIHRPKDNNRVRDKASHVRSTNRNIRIVTTTTAATTKGTRTAETLAVAEIAETTGTKTRDPADPLAQSWSKEK
jgi:hypothetical protein